MCRIQHICVKMSPAFLVLLACMTLGPANGTSLRKTVESVAPDETVVTVTYPLVDSHLKDGAATLEEAMASVSDDHDLSAFDLNVASENSTKLPVQNQHVSLPSSSAHIQTAKRRDAHIQRWPGASITNATGDDPHDKFKEIASIFKRPLMGAVNVMRIELCLRRPDLMSHEECLKFLLEMCLKESTGYGYCQGYLDDLEAPCRRGELLPGESKPCELHDQLAARVHPELEAGPPPEACDDFTPSECPTDRCAMIGGACQAAPETTAPPPNTPQQITANTPQQITAQPEVSPPIAPAPAAPASAPSASAPVSALPASPGTAAVASVAGPTGLDKRVPESGLPVQGYNEHSEKNVVHKNFETQTGDWRSEWPSSGETEDQSTDRICKEQPDLLWCRMWKTSRQ